MKQLIIHTKLDSLIYVHHKGQFFHLNHPPKIQVYLGKKLFVNINHELTYSLETSGLKGGQNCLKDHNYGLENCVINVSK